jgi:hypothetical protein
VRRHDTDFVKETIMDAEKAVQYLVKDKDGKGHLPYTKEDGKPDHGLMGAAHAALTSPKGFRGRKYEGPDKSKALAKLKKIYKEEKMELPSEKAAKALNRLIQMRSSNGREGDGTKFVTFAIKTVREATAAEVEADPAEKGLFVEGILAGEEPDFEGEILDYKSSKPNFQAWNENASKLTGGKSVGNLRGQHNPKVAAGKFVAMNYDDKNLSIPCVAKVIDPVEQDKVREGVYTSFSVGAHYARKWKDGKYVRWTADPFEGSLVDFGAIPMTRGFTYRAADGTEEERAFDGGRRQLRKAFESLGKPLTVEDEDRVVKAIGSMQAARKGLYTISGFAQLLQELIYLRESITFEREMEGDDSPVTDRVAEAVEELLECLAAYTQEQVSEEIGKANSKEEKTVDIKDVSKDLPRTAPPTDPAAAGTKPTDEQIALAVKGINDSLAILKTAGVDLSSAFKAYSQQPGSAPGGHDSPVSPAASDDKAVATDPKAKGHAELTKEECKAEDCDVHKKGKAAAACGKSESECTDEKCMTHKGKKTAAAGAGDGEALKRADVQSLIDNSLGNRFAAFQEKFEKDVATPLSEQLKAIGETLAAIGAAPVPTSVKPRAVTLVGKDVEANRDAQDADKAIADDVKNGRTVSAVQRIRERGGNRVAL